MKKMFQIFELLPSEDANEAMSLIALSQHGSEKEAKDELEKLGDNEHGYVILPVYKISD